MTRIGINPARGKCCEFQPSRVTVAIVTYIPSLDGYFENRLDVLKLSLASLHAHTVPNHDIYIFDNGSCDPVVKYLVSLRDRGLIDCLLLSPRNIGKINALRLLFSSAPGELIAYNDDDILFYPGWLEAHLEVLVSFPQVGMVSGVPVRNAAKHAFQSLTRFANNPPQGIKVLRERRIPDEWEADWALSTGREPQEHLYATQDQLDLVLRSESDHPVEAIGAANHFQFVALKEIIMRALPETWSDKLMGSMIELDEAIDQFGYLRLSTTRRFSRHMGNFLSDELRSETARMGLVSSSKRPAAIEKAKNKHKHWLLRIPGSRKVLFGLYRRLFDILYVK